MKPYIRGFLLGTLCVLDRPRVIQGCYLVSQKLLPGWVYLPKFQTIRFTLFELSPLHPPLTGFSFQEFQHLLHFSNLLMSNSKRIQTYLADTSWKWKISCINPKCLKKYEMSKVKIFYSLLEGRQDTFIRISLLKGQFPWTCTITPTNQSKRPYFLWIRFSSFQEVHFDFIVVFIQFRRR